MKRLIFLLTAVLILAIKLDAQTLYMPSGLGGVGNSINGNVGIGTSSPSDKLDVFGSLYFGDGSNNFIAHIRGVYAVSWAWNISNQGTGHNILLTMGGACPISVAFNGNLGIGTTKPVERVHISGNLDVLRVGPDFSDVDRDFVDIIFAKN